MYPPRIKRSGIRYPLDDVLGTLATVRLMRVLVHEVDGPVSVASAAKMAGLSHLGTKKSLESLEKVGAVVRFGAGRTVVFAPVESNPFISAFRELFEIERRRYEDLTEELRKSVSMNEIRDAWLEDVSTGEVRTLHLKVVTQARSVSWMESELRARLASIEKLFDVIVEVVVFTRADSPRGPGDAVILWGDGYLSNSATSVDIQVRPKSAKHALKTSRNIAEMIKSNPSLIRRALQYTNRLLREGQGIAGSDIGEWRHLLETYSPERLRELLVSESSRAERLRRSSPFLPILTPEEREIVLEEVNGEV
jgi:hypothetical protein